MRELREEYPRVAERPCDGGHGKEDCCRDGVEPGEAQDQQPDVPYPGSGQKTKRQAIEPIEIVKARAHDEPKQLRSWRVHDPEEIEDEQCAKSIMDWNEDAGCAEIRVVEV